MTNRHSLSMALVALLSASQASAQSAPSAAAPSSSIAGKWRGCFSREGRTACSTYTFAVKGDTLSGTITNDDGSDPHAIRQGRMAGDRVTFRTGYGDAIVCTGTFRDGRMWKLDCDVTDNGQKFTNTLTRM
jgi:hypothetical protein